MMLALLAVAPPMGAALGCAPREGAGKRPPERPSASVETDTSARQLWRVQPPPPPRTGPAAPISAPSTGIAAGIVAEAAPDAPQGSGPAAGLPPSRGFKPPLLKFRPPLRSFPGRDSVDVDLWVDARGQVTRARWAAGSDDTARVRAAVECALGMTFYPALQDGRPVAATSQQRFRFGARE